MRGKDVEIAIQRLHVHGQPRHRLASVEQDLRAHTVRHIRRASYIKDRAQHVRHMRQRYDLVPGGQHRSHGVEIDLPRSEEHTSELQSLMRISYAVFCLKKKKTNTNHIYIYHTHKKNYNIKQQRNIVYTYSI